MLTKTQADDINNKFVKFITIIDSQKKELLKPVIVDTVVVIQEDTAVGMCKAYYEGRLKECYILTVVYLNGLKKLIKLLCF